MNKIKIKSKKSLLLFILSLLSVALGIWCIAWVMLSICPQFTYFSKVYTTVYPAVGINLKSYLTTADKILYPNYPTEGDKIGSLSIPTLNRKLPIFQGTGTEELEKGVGHFIQSVLPGEVDNSVISGHRETFFRQLYKLKKGDQLIVQTSAGTFTYEVSGTRIVDQNDRTVIVPTDHAVLTMTTCYPFNYFVSSTERYIVSADLVKTE